MSGTSLDRRSERTELFLVATLYFGGVSNPVRVRNLSATGGLVEGASLPPVGTAVILRRGALEAPGTAVWAEDGKAGLSFSGQVNVSDWLPVKEGKRQTQIDQIAFGLKHTARPVAVVAVVPVDDANMSIIAVIAELRALQAQLGQLGDKLAEDAFVLANHPEVQLLDAAGQRIGKLIEAIRAARA